MVPFTPLWQATGTLESEIDLEPQRALADPPPGAGVNDRSTTAPPTAFPLTSLAVRVTFTTLAGFNDAPGAIGVGEKPYAVTEENA
jgi:hypothetical protein